MGFEEDHRFNLSWLKEARRVLKPDGTIWVTGTHHIIFSIGFALQSLGFRVINSVVWEKPDPPPNAMHTSFTHSHETVIWASKGRGVRHTFNYDLINSPDPKSQVSSVWRIPAVTGREKRHGYHPTQKPLRLVRRALLASTLEGGLVFDPFCGSGTTAVAAKELDRFCVGAELERDYAELAARRVKAAERGAYGVRSPRRSGTALDTPGEAPRRRHRRHPYSAPCERIAGEPSTVPRTRRSHPARRRPDGPRPPRRARRVRSDENRPG